MNALLDLLLQPVVRAGEWVSLASGLPRMVGVVGVALVVVLIIALFLQAACVPVGDVETAVDNPPGLDLPSARYLLGDHAAIGHVTASRGEAELASLRDGWAALIADEPDEPAPDFSGAPRRAQAKPRERIAPGEVQELPVDVKRLEFLRWLIQSGRLEG
ncbi:MAG: hypothetical protein IT307_01245 [Chloroflexi bacterium]|nr:hypothetical protein [Chloroflexota bacterium]